MDCYPIPQIEQLLDHLSGCSVFSNLDLQTGNYKNKFKPAHLHMSAFAYKISLFEFKLISFGLSNAPSTF